MLAPLYFASEPVSIDRDDWRVIVTDSISGGRRFAYQFRQSGDLPIWLEMQQWPGFTLDAVRLGLPVALARLYDANFREIQAALHPEPESYAALLLA